MLQKLDVELHKQNKSREDFEIVITPLPNALPSTVQEYSALGVDRLVLHLGNQKPERVKKRLGEAALFLEQATST